MARIVKLDQLLPEDIAFEMPDGHQYLAPGDPPLTLILKVAELFDKARGANGKDGVGLEILEELDAQVLELLRMRDETLISSPFGVIGVQHFVAELLAAYNFGDEEEALPPTKTRPAAAKSVKSKRSTGSRSS